MDCLQGSSDELGDGLDWTFQSLHRYIYYDKHRVSNKTCIESIDNLKSTC